MNTLRRQFPVARKNHRCGSCDSGTIAKGERYHLWVGTGDEWDGIATHRECEACFRRYGQYRYLNPENRALADEWLGAGVKP